MQITVKHMNTYFQYADFRVTFAENLTKMAQVRTRPQMLQLKEYAKLLYTKEKLTQKEIAARVNVSEVTLSKWAKTDKWGELLMSLSTTREERMKSTIAQLTELDKWIADKELGSRFPSSKEADTRRKLVSDLQALEVECGVKDIINVSVKLLDWLRKVDIAKAQEISDYFDAFIKESLK